MGNFCDQSTETTLYEICVQVCLRFSDSSKPSQCVSLIYELAQLAWISKSEENLLKTSCKVAPMTKVAHIFWWRQDNWQQSASARAHWCDVSCDIPYCLTVFMKTHQSPEPTRPPRCHRGSGLDCGSEDPGSIPGILSPCVGPLMARRLKGSSNVPVPVSG